MTHVRQVTGTIHKPDGSPWPEFAIGFDVPKTAATTHATLPGTSVGAGTTAHTIITQTNASGEFAVDLEVDVTIRVTMLGALVTAGTSTRYPGDAQFSIVVPDGDTPITLHDIIAANNTPVTPTLLGRVLPEGGTTGQALVKASGYDYDAEWADVEGGGAAEWGSITGDIADQADLQQALDSIQTGGQPGVMLVAAVDDGEIVADTHAAELTPTIDGTVTIGEGPTPDMDAMVFGSGGRVTVPASLSVWPDEGSIEAWVYRESDPGGNQYIFAAGRKGVTGNDFVGLRVDGSDKASIVWHAIGIGSEQSAQTEQSVPVGSWHYLYADWLGTELRVGLDAYPLATGSRGEAVGFFDQTMPDAVGAYNNSVAGTFAGRVAGVRVNRRRLSDAERAARYASTTPWRLSQVPTMPVLRREVAEAVPANPAEVVIGTVRGHERVVHMYDVRAFGAIGNGVTDDGPAIMAAHAAAHAAGGGIVWLPTGHFKVATTLNGWRSNVSLIGAGVGRAVLVHTNYGFSCIQEINEYSAANPMRNVTFAGFELDASQVVPTGAYSSSRKGFFILYMKDVVFRDLYVHDTLATGIGVDFLVNALFQNVVVENCGRHNDGTQPGGAGIGIATGASPDENTILDGVTLIGNKRYGAFFEQATQFPTVFSSYMKIVNSHAAENGHGFVDAGVSRMIVESSSSVRNVLSGYAANRGTIAPNAGHENALINVDLHENGEHGVHIDYRGNEAVGKYHLKEVRARGNTGDGLRLDIGDNDVPDMWFESCDFSDNGGYGIREISTGGELIDSDVVRNRVTGNTAGSIDIPDAGAGTIIRENRGHATEATGTSAIPDGESSVDVPHGLVATPGNVIATPRGPESVWVSARDADAFTLSRAGSSGVLTVDWAATTASG